MQITDKREIPEELILEVEKLSNLGYGICRVNGYVIFAEGACSGDIVRLKVGKKNKNFAMAKVIEIIKPSVHRVKPFCPMQNVCGACQLQFIDYDYQLKLKKEIVEDALKTILGECPMVSDVVPSPDVKEFRHKIQYPVSQTKNSKRLLAGYYKKGSHDIINIKYCPIQPKICDDIIDFIRECALEFGISGYDEKKHSGDLRHVVIRASRMTKKNLVVLVLNSKKAFDKARKLAENLYEHFEEVSGVLFNYNPEKTNLIMSKNTELIIGKDFVEEALCDKVFNIGADTFFQVNPSSADNLFRYVKDYIFRNFDKPLILDAYAGITAFGICMSDMAKKVVSVEEVKQSVLLAERIIKNNNIKNVELHNMDAGAFFEKELRTKKRSFDITILDPPRKGCTEQSLEYAYKLTKGKIIYVSCNPSTLARDLKYLKTKGCTIESICPFDMFPYTYHIENVAVIAV